MEKNLKKLKIFFCLIFIFAISLGISLPKQNVEKIAFADGTVYIASITDFAKIGETGTYVLQKDIDANGEIFSPIKSFKGSFNGNGYTISNLTITAPKDSSVVGLFCTTQNATIKNLKLLNVNLATSHNSSFLISKVGFLVGDAKGTLIENCHIASQDSKSKLTAESSCSVMIGGIVGDAEEGTLIKNCVIDVNLTVNSNSTDETKSFYVGSCVGRLNNSTIYNTISYASITPKTKVSSNTYCGGVIGYILGNKSLGCNLVFVGDISNSLETYSGIVGSIIGAVSVPNDTIINDSFNYFHTTSSLQFVGNKAEIENYFNNNIIALDLSKVIVSVQQLQSLQRKEFYIVAGNFDPKKEWNFGSVWQIAEKVSLPTLQVFENYQYTFSEDASFTSLTKPTGIDNVITTLGMTDKNYKYGNNIIFGGNITQEKQINSFYKIVGLRKDGEVILDNSQITKILSDENTIKTETSATSNKYVLGNNTLISNQSSYSGQSFEIYTLNNSDISWGTYENLQSEVVNIYVISSCDATDVGQYSFILDTIKYKITVKSESAENGTIRRGTADSSVKNEEIVDTIFYGQTISYVASPTDDFAFNAWKLTSESETNITTSTTVQTKFNENIFEEGGIFEGLKLTENDLTLYATFTKNVCLITFKFAVNDIVGSANLSKVYIDGVEITPVDNVYSKKVKMGTTHTIKVVLPSEYEFTNWFVSDGTSNLGVISQSIETQITASEEDSAIYVANFFKEEKKADNSLIIWLSISGGVILLGGIIAIIIVVVKKKNEGNSYKNFYY